MGKLMLLDGHSLAYRAFFALPPDLGTQTGQVTNAVYGFTAMLIRAIDDERPTGICVAFDRSDHTFRNEEYADYKAEREETPDLFRSQIPLIHEVLDVLRIPQIDVAGYEADDILATLASQAAADGEDVVIVTGDRDTFQLVEDPHIKVMYNRRGITDVVMYDEAAVMERYGIRPDQYVDFAALRGDPSDNLPGVPGVGEKTAAKLLAKYGDIEGIYEHLDEQTPKLRENLASHREQVELNRRLSRLVRDVDLELSWRDCVQGEIDREEVKSLFSTLAFKTLLERVLKQLPASGAPAGTPEVADVDVEVIRKPAALSALVKRVEKEGPVAIEALTDTANRAVGVAIGISDSATTAILFDQESLKSKLEEALSGPSLQVDAHRLIETVRALDFAEVAGLDIDTAICAYLLDPAGSRYELDDVALRYLGLEVTSPDKESGGQVSLGLEGPDLEAAARRVSAIRRLAPALRSELEEQGLWELYEDVERPLVGVLARMEKIGIKIDVDFLEELAESFRDKCRQYEREIWRHAGEEFNVNSTPVLREILFAKLGLTPTKKKKTGYSTDAASLEAIRDEHPIVEALLAYREVEKLRSTVEGFPPLVGKDGRLHPRYNQTAAATGRISSEAPNVQNVPVRTEIGRQIRRAFVAERGWEFCIADYNQIELRVLAHISQDEGLLEAFASGEDVHRATAAMVFGVEPEKVDSEMRRRAKMVNYGLSYGLEAFGLAQRLGIAPDEARGFIDAYFENFPGVHDYMENVVAEAKEKGYTETVFGRRRPLPELSHSNYQVRKMGERMAMNAPIQGTAADIIKMAMIAVDEELSEARLLLQVHDELVLEVRPKEKKKVGAKLVELMESVTELDVPLEVDLGFGPNWEAAKK